MTQRTSHQLKAIRGTARADRAPKSTGGERLTEAPLPPAGMSELAAAEWRQLADVLVRSGMLVESDLRALELLAETLATEAQLREILRGRSLMMESDKGHPAFRMQLTTRTLAARLFDQFGMTPKAREGVSAQPTAKRKSLWDQLDEQ